MLRKLVTFIVAAAMLIQAPVASAADLASAFQGLLVPGSAIATNAPGRYQSSARNTFVAGGLEMRFPKQQNSPQLFSFTPPRVVAGCNGVSAYFGGFSFISGQEFEQMVKSIASGAALGFVTMLTMKSLCPQCADVVQQLKNAAQVAARLSIDSCKLGQEVYKKFNGEQTDFSSTLCGSTTSDSGASNDFLSAINKQCNSIAGALDGLEDANPDTKSDSTEGKAKKERLKCISGTGNVTWNALGGSVQALNQGDDNYGRKIILMNMMGVVLRAGNQVATCEVAGGKTLSTSDLSADEQIYCSPTISAKDIAGAFMCGTDGGALNAIGSPAAKDYCRTFFENSTSSANGSPSFSGVQSAKLLTCGSDTIGCMNLKLQSLEDAKISTGVGFLPRVADMLSKAVDNVRNNKPLDPEFIGLMQAAPYPLYQAVNAAAVYPAAAADLLDSISILVAESAAASYMEEFLRFEGRDSGAKCTSEEQVRRIIETLATARAENRARRLQIAQNMQLQSGLREQIRQINLAIQQQVMSGELLHQNQFAEALTRAATPSRAGSSAVSGDESGTVSTVQP